MIRHHLSVINTLIVNIIEIVENILKMTFDVLTILQSLCWTHSSTKFDKGYCRDYKQLVKMN